MNCDEIQKHLSEYLDNRLDDAQRREIEKHLASCPRCLPEAKLLSAGIKGVADLPEVEPPAGFSQRVMARIRAEAEKPTLWARLFQPFKIKIPLHATALLLVVGLAVYLYRANEPVQREMSPSIPSESAPSLKQVPPPEEPESTGAQQEEPSPTIAVPSAPPSVQRFSDSQQSPPAEVDRLESSLQKENAPAPAQEMMKFKEAESKEAPSETSASAGAPLPGAGEQQMAEVSSKRESPSPPDILLTLLTRGKADESGNLSSKVKELVERSGGTLHLVVERDDPDNAKPRFRLDLSKSEYNRFKAELTQIGEIISESQPPSSRPQSGAKPSSSMSIELTFLFEKSKDDGANPPSPN